MIPLIVLRPEPGCAATCMAAREMGLEAHAFPLFVIRSLDWQAPPPDSFDALLIGSANALRHGGTALAAYATRPAYVVGEATAAAAREAGLDVIAIGKGGLQGVLDRLQPGHTRLLRLTGRERVELALPPGVTMAERVLYASDPQAIPVALATLLADPALVLLHSAEAARHFAGECQNHRIDRSVILLATLGPRISAAAGQGWASVSTAGSADDTALLALSAELCQKNDRSKTGHI